jgi:hypothetical protein
VNLRRAARHILWHDQSGGLGCGVERHRGLLGRSGCPDRRVFDAHVQGVQDNAPGRLGEADLNGLRAAEAGAGQIHIERQIVVIGGHGSGEPLGGNGGCGKHRRDEQHSREK